jgi:murein DD-endopeptidase MepM/ murein hydrolase activator NlpD
VRVIHEQGSVGFMDVLFQAESISNFLIRWEYVRAVAEFDRDMLDRLAAAENDVVAHREDLDRWRGSMESLQVQYRRLHENLEFVLEERAEWFARLAEDEAMLAQLVAIAEEEQRRAESAFADIQAQLRREEDAATRQRTAAEHSARLAQLNDFNGQFDWPIPTHSRISSPFGMRMHPILRQNRMHTGIDVGAPTGTRLIAAADGYVRFAGWSGGFGNTVIIDHGDGYSTLYAHNSRNRVVSGQVVTRGQHIADVGSTGMSTGPHLHFEIRINNRAVDPLLYFQ